MTNLLKLDFAHFGLAWITCRPETLARRDSLGASLIGPTNSHYWRPHILMTDSLQKFVAVAES
jgi:hypothetical protein